MTATSGTALVIDDEGLVRQLVRRMLEPDIEVLDAPDGERGLRLVEQRMDHIDVVLTDLLMPGIDGYDVLDVLATHCPDLPVACMSGFASHTSVGREILVPFLPKPFSEEGLRDTLVPLLARSWELHRAARADGQHAGAERATSQALRRQAAAAHETALDLVAAAHELQRRRASGSPKR
ncbi:MAG: response regulator [Gemmatimonadales bacterium]